VKDGPPGLFAALLIVALNQIRCRGLEITEETAGAIVRTCGEAEFGAELLAGLMSQRPLIAMVFPVASRSRLRSG
jgi:hypothetical protein